MLRVIYRFVHFRNKLPETLLQKKGLMQRNNFRSCQTEIEEAILSVHEGKLYMSLDTNLSSTDKQEMRNIPVLSSREKEVLQLIADGMTNPQMATTLFLSLHTVDSHRKNLLTKFGVNNTAGLIKLAVKFNMV